MTTAFPTNALPCRHLSLREAVTLAEVPEERVKKDIERGWVDPIRVKHGAGFRLFVRWHDVFSLAAAYNNSTLTSKGRCRVISRWNSFLDTSYGCADWATAITRVERENLAEYVIVLDKYIIINMKSVFDEVAPRVAMYARGLDRIEKKEGVLSGEYVFKNTRLSVTHVGGMIINGETIENVLEDYPYLNRDDVSFARLFYLANPPTGRPRSSNGMDDVGT